MKSSFYVKLIFLLSAGIVLAPIPAAACACGCGVFNVGTSSMLPSGAGGMVYLNYDYQDQNQNWSGTSSAPADSNDDKEISTHFLTLGLQYLFNRSWGVKVEAPYWFRYFNTEDDDGNLVADNFSGVGDIRIQGMYTGFSEDLSTGVSLGLKLPTGSHTQDSDVVDRDTQIGSGSTDVLAGGFFRHALTASNRWTWLFMAQLDVPFLSQDGYTPGSEFDESLGIHYNPLMLGLVQIKPLAQIIASERLRDTGPNSADPVASGYQRILLSPGLEFHFHPVKFYADAEWPVLQNVKGNQIVAPVLFKVSLASAF